MISILTLNLRIEAILDGIHTFTRRKPGLLRCLTDERPDVLGFQEMTERMLAAFQEGLPTYGLIGEANKPHGKREYNTIAYRLDTLTLLKTETFWLSPTPDVPGSRFLIQSPDARTCTWAEFRHNATGVRFRYFNTHLDHLSPSARAKGLLVIFEHIATLQQQEKLPIFLGGDFNFTPRSPLYGLLREYRIGDQPLVDLSRLLPTTFHWFGKLKRPFKLDYVFTDADTASGLFEVRVLRYNDEGSYLSDHDAVRMDWDITETASQGNA